VPSLQLTNDKSKTSYNIVQHNNILLSGEGKCVCNVLKKCTSLLKQNYGKCLIAYLLLLQNTLALCMFVCGLMSLSLLRAILKKFLQSCYQFHNNVAQLNGKQKATCCC